MLLALARRYSNERYSDGQWMVNAVIAAATKTLPKPYNHHRTLTTCASKNPLTDVVHSGQPDPDGHSFGSYFDADDKPREECGVVGIYGDSEASRLCYLELHALQHRGQEGAGIVCVNDNVHKSITGVGLVSDVFSESKLDQLPGDLAIGHVRYSTAGASMLKNVQPFVASYRFGSVGVAHNGNLVNYKQLRGELEENGSIFNTSSDTEVVLHLIAISKARPFLLRIVEACEKIEGAYSMVFGTEDKLVAVRDPYGFRPLVMGRRSNGAIVFASETCALDLIEANYEREVLPGEVVVVDKGVQSICLMPHPERKSCIFEHIYFALPNSVVFGRSVYESRRAFGEILATEAPVECDVVIAVPEHIYFALPNSVVHINTYFEQNFNCAYRSGVESSEWCGIAVI
ncbi:amidophosphoribosyltransferase 2, chloroplastic-like [Capsicum annuum]|uniref:amidophosphoribosyltransferase 2, chloroplastic-like n=1 Tax=Capsicum annuum TaxID=4072 RepID=UPI001FB11FFB|nr:amidophosphoribosyltransferase 2, chloroplastic-like [Capsicum annuum]